jgi:hypothetical protein
MNYLDSATSRDLRKNVENVRMDLICEAILSSNFELKDLGAGDNKQSGKEAKLFFNTSALNVESLSLLRDSVPSLNYTTGHLSCGWRLSTRFTEENRDNLHEMMMQRVIKEVEQVFNIRQEAMKGAQVPIREATVVGQVEAPGFWAKVGSVLGVEKRREHDAGMSLG